MSSNGETIAAEAFPLSGSHLIAVARSHQPWFDRRYEMAAYWVFAAYAVAVVLLAGGQDVIWAAWAAPAYCIAAVALPWSRSWGVAALVAVFAVAAPLLVMMAQGGELAAGMTVIERSATLLIRDGTPYLSSGQLSSWLAYNPYLPAMALFGLPSAIGLQGAPGDPRVWLVLVTVAALAAALSLGVPHSVRDCAGCRRTLLRSIAIATACPAVALNLAVTTTDPPVLALMVLALALLKFPERIWLAAVALGLACAMKPTAWLAIPVLAAMLRYRDGTRAAVTFTVTSVAVFLAITLPVMLANPVAMAQNTVLFPLGLTAHLTPAAEPDPGRPAGAHRPGRPRPLGRPAARGRHRRGRPAAHPPAAQPAGGRLVAGDRAGPHVHARARRALRVLHLPARPGRLAGAHPSGQTRPRTQCRPNRPRTQCRPS